jgi:CRISPR/Cas system-associated exonuclease Cas4 (RecB family)
LVIRLSWSQLRNAEECKQKRFLTTTGARRETRDQRLFLPGNVTDRVVRNWLKNDPANHKGEMPDMVNEMIDAVRQEILDKGERIAWKRDIEDREKIRKECIEAVTNIEPALLRYVVPFKYQADFRFDAPLVLPGPNGPERIFLIGYMDIHVEDDKGRYWVFDVKHTKDDQYWRKTVGQLTFYDTANLLLFGKKTTRTGLFQPLCKRPIFPYEVTDDKRLEMYQRIVGVANDVWNGDNSPRKDNKYCNFCDVRTACEKWKPVVGDDGKKRVSF